MIVGCGIDILDIERMEKALTRTPAIARRVLTPLEYEVFKQSREPARQLAKFFAAKEAVVKALGTGFSQGVSWQDIQVEKNALGKPLISLTGKAQAISQMQGILNWHMSYSDEKAAVVALAIAETSS